ncbi:acetylornithine deacetylase [Erwiniaceae bacterium BAC15a-03b]|uniref:Acetylornithine deacetylase n=1 Tax=Winslowiella arboricola TaxID=2978220 RepID=A0A9J6PLV6_9GAMM|nr:acetylornithine deacetylase [Winslowiella arboricola]MCU5773848.1 acetylornithine deacetylase [Winslowiella arboricola]MCU5777758.1 acetylornithine deacetylase [Winslowiella arboricola]
MPTDIRQLLDLVDSREDELIALLCELIAFATPAPPARNTAQAQAFIAGYLRELGCAIDSWDIYPGDPNVVGTLKGSDSAHHHSLIINGHIDVAEVSPQEAWESGPFQPIVRDDVVIGRGAADMKGGVAGALFALKLLREQQITLPGDLIFQSVIGEEVGEAGTLECCKRGYSADLALIVDTSDLHIQGQGGVITGWITVKSPQSFHDGTRSRMIHAGGGLVGASAIEKMMKIIQGLQELERHWAVVKSYPGCPPGATTINPAVIEGGRHAAFIADECRLWITVHYYPNENHQTIVQEIENHIQAVASADPWLRDHPPQFRWGGKSMIEDRGEIFPSLEVDPEHAGIRLLAQRYADISGKPAIIDVSPTVTDGGWFGHVGIPAAIFGPGKLEHAHSVNEQVSISQLKQYVKVLLTFIVDWTATPSDS